MTDPKPTPEDMERAERLRVEVQDMVSREETTRIALEFARVRAEECAQLQSECEQAHLKALEIGARNEREACTKVCEAKRVGAALDCDKAGEFMARSCRDSIQARGAE